MTTILITVLLGIIVFLIYGKRDVKRIIAPLLILLLGDFLLLYAKFVVGDDIGTLILYLPATILLVISVIWWVITLIVILKRDIAGKERIEQDLSRKATPAKTNRRKIIALVLCFAMTAAIVAVPALKKDDKFKLYQNDYLAVSEAIFQAYDEGEITVGDEFGSPPYKAYDLDKLNALFSANIVKHMKILNRSAGIYDYILADEDVVYFSFGASLQSIDGIAVCRNGKDPSADEALKRRFFDGNTSFSRIADGAYHFRDGL